MYKLQLRLVCLRAYDYIEICRQMQVVHFAFDVGTDLNVQFASDCRETSG